MTKSQTGNNQTAILVDHVSKQYRLGQIGGTTLREELQRAGARLRHKEDPTSVIGMDGQEVDENGDFLALDDISFRIPKGQRVGIIGRNGAGKSTLLKLISHVTIPTSGRIGINGRVASMLEVGTGFHGELTGRENVYMNGAILGMSSKEIDSKIDSIIEFSEVGKFIDTPVKRYSSGMYVKLGFSVAAHLNSEVMIMDEVLAVGDVAFQKKCLDRMNEISRTEGRTILYVSHNMNTIRTLCERCIVLQMGKLIYDGEVSGAIDCYLKEAKSVAETSIDISAAKIGRLHPDYTIEFLKIEIPQKETPKFEHGEKMKLEITLKSPIDLKEASLRLELKNRESVPVATIIGEKLFSLKAGQCGIFSVLVDTVHLAPGEYSVTLTAYQVKKDNASADLDCVEDAFSFEITDTYNRMPVTWFHSHWGHIVLKDLELSDVNIVDEVEL